MDIPARPGRAKVERNTLLRAAADIFFEQGYAATSIDAIIERAGGSKRNIYSEFGSKEGLFTAIVTEHLEKALSALAMEDMEARDLRGTLTAFGRQLLDVLLSPALIGVYRTVVIENARFPELVQKFYNHGPGRASSRLAEVLEEAQRRGEIQVGDCAQAADHFSGMIRGNLHLQVVLGLRPSPEDEEAQAIVASAVEIFIGGVRNRGTA